MSSGSGALGLGGHERVLLGVISDTHGTVPAGVHDAFEGVDAIVHAGDIGGSHVLDELTAIAPVLAVLGNTDHALPEWDVPVIANARFAGLRVFVVHDLGSVRELPEDVSVVVSGHTHRARVEREGDVLFVNPGSPSRSRGGGHTVALLEIEDGAAGARVVELG